MSDGGTMTRVAAIQKRLEAAAPDGNLFVANIPAPLHPALSMFLFHVAADIAYLLRLVELAAAMPEPTAQGTGDMHGYRVCLECRAKVRWYDWQALQHAPDCPYAVFRAALEEVVAP